ncbi:MAG: dihydroxyacetone kinase subunit DhaK [Devosia sp.]
MFYNRREEIVSDAIDGLVAGSGGRLMRFRTDDQARVVLRADWDLSKVAVVSGGGSGHEPSHAGLVGMGLLTAAVCGEIFASPSVDAVLAAIVAVTGDAGCLLVVKNYTGDLLNFGLAAERARAMGLKVEMVIVADDIAIPDAPRPRGVAGTLFVHKIAGHMAEAGARLDAIKAAVEDAMAGLFTIGVARDACSVPGSPKISRIGPGQVEIGLGIHGEPGVDLAELKGSRELIADLAVRLSPHVKPGAIYAVLFNNLGGLANLECMVLVADLLRSPLASSIKFLAGPSGAMTALDMPGFSISFLELTPERESMLLAPAACPSLPVFQRVGAVVTVAAPSISEAMFAPSSDTLVRRVVETIIATCIGMEAEVNALDAKVGDGDTGSTFATGARAVQGALDRLPFAVGGDLLQALSDIKRKAMGGSSGVLFAIMLARAGEAYRETPDWTSALLAGLDAMQAYGGASLGDRTMVDALRPALNALRVRAGLKGAAAAAREGANGTARMLRANAGRSAYLEARSLEGINDPGAEAVARIFDALAVTEKGEV